MNSNQRQPQESQQQYRERMRSQNKASKGRINRILWDSSTQGTYIKKVHGELK